MSQRNNYRILIVDDEPPWHNFIREAFKKNYAFDGAVSGEKMWEKLRSGEQYDLLLLDLRLDGTEEKTGLDLLPQLGAQHPGLPVIVATNSKDPDAVVTAMEAGAKGFLFKSQYEKTMWDKKFQDIIEANRAEKLSAENKKLRKEVERHEEREEDEKYRFIGNSPPVQEIKEFLRGLAEESRVTILLTGETGTGKEVAARYLHKMGPRHHKPFVAVNLSNLPVESIENELFGHVKGAYTDATTDQIGHFHRADGGVLLLDEIGHISAIVQDKLMRFLENRVISPLGSGKEIALDIQLVAATNLDLSQEVKKGTFRDDLYQRLKNVVVEIPPLRQRKEDIPLILEHYMRLQNPNAVPFELMTREVVQHLFDYDWPGNIRELRNAIDYMLLRMRIFKKPQIDMKCLPPDLLHGNAATQDSPQAALNSSSQRPRSNKEEKAHLDLVKIESALRQTGGNKTAVAEILGIKGTDHLRARILTCYKNFPEMFPEFPEIRRQYNL
ncbi:MAG: sigma-54-dependent Fis family transcriptional regulator [Saprospiraceae bacterium]|nr:sigma-54-dependent Fis family transcriptional regulator [Saprospiraceae bacterium]